MIRSMMGRKKVDRNTLLLLHFDGSLKDEASGKPYVGSNMSYVVGKFKNCVSFSGNGYVKISGTNAINESLYPNYTVDFWIKLKSGVRNGIMSKGNGGGSYSFDIMEESDGRIFFGLQYGGTRGDLVERKFPNHLDSAIITTLEPPIETMKAVTNFTYSIISIF